jgi:hypothetical protein
MVGASKRPGLLVVVIVATILLFILQFDYFLSLIKGATESLGMSTRFFDLLSVNELFVSYGREWRAEAVLSGIKENWFLGYGLAGDRILIGDYVHNIVLEFWASFGVIFGTTLFVILLYILVRGMRTGKNQDEKVFILILICCGFLKLFISGTYLDEANFFLLIGLCVFEIRQHRHFKQLSI